jgi:hypothetical protein
MKWNKINGIMVAALLVVVGTLWAARHLSHPAPPVLPGVPGGAEPAATNQMTGLDETVQQLETEHARLSASLLAANAENARLETAKAQAEHGARLFKALAEQATVQDQNPTNTYPSLRHLLAGIGKLTRLGAEAAAKWGNNVDPQKLPPAEREALFDAEAGMQAEFFRLEQAKKLLNAQNQETALTPETMADTASCYLYGLLDLDSGQFSQINGVLQSYCQQAVQQGLLQAAPGESEDAATNRVAALDQLNQNARAAVQTLLSSKQAELLGSEPLGDVKFVTARFRAPLIQEGE